MVKQGPVSKLKEELRRKEAEVAEFRSLALRAAAELDNARKRWERERAEFRLQAQAEVLRDLCEVWDNFERALALEAGDGGQTLAAYRRGVELIFNQFRETLAKHGLKQYSCVGDGFDPLKAEAVGHQETTQVEPGKVVEELKKGFMLGERVIRPAQVIVAKEVKKQKSQEEASEPEKQGG